MEPSVQCFSERPDLLTIFGIAHRQALSVALNTTPCPVIIDEMVYLEGHLGVGIIVFPSSDSDLNQWVLTNINGARKYRGGTVYVKCPLADPSYERQAAYCICYASVLREFRITTRVICQFDA